MYCLIHRTIFIFYQYFSSTSICTFTSGYNLLTFPRLVFQWWDLADKCTTSLCQSIKLNISLRSPRQLRSHFHIRRRRRSRPPTVALKTPPNFQTPPLPPRHPPLCYPPSPALSHHGGFWFGGLTTLLCGALIIDITPQRRGCHGHRARDI